MSRSHLAEPVHTRLHAAFGVSAIQEVCDISTTHQGLSPSQPIRLSQTYTHIHTHSGAHQKVSGLNTVFVYSTGTISNKSVFIYSKSSQYISQENFEVVVVESDRRQQYEAF